MSVQNTSIYSNNQNVTSGTKLNQAQNSLANIEPNLTPVSIGNQGATIEIKAAQNPIKSSGHVNHLVINAFQPIASDSAPSKIKYERIPRQLTNRKERTKEAQVARQALQTMPKIGPKNPVIAESRAVPVGPRFVYTPPNKIPPKSISEAAGINIAPSPNSPAWPQTKVKRTYIPRKLPRNPKPEVPHKPISAALSTSSPQPPNSPVSLQKPMSEASVKSDHAPNAKGDPQPFESLEAGAKPPQLYHRIKVNYFKALVNDPVKLERLGKYAQNNFITNDIDFLLKVKDFQENKNMTIQQKTILANDILNYIDEGKINVSKEIRKFYTITKVDINKLEQDNFNYIMDYMISEFMDGHKTDLNQFLTTKGITAIPSSRPSTKISSANKSDQKTEQSAVSEKKRPSNDKKPQSDPNKLLGIFNKIVKSLNYLKNLRNTQAKNNK